MATTVFGPGPDTLVVDDRPVAPVAVARTARERRGGLLGTDAVEGALWITRCPTVHMVGMRYPIDVAVLDRHGVVLRTATLRPTWGMTRPRLRASATVECPVGSLDAWGVRTGSRLSVRPGPAAPDAR
jgi:uncharacterized membrane protein (UPF0127 family)